MKNLSFNKTYMLTARQMNSNVSHLKTFLLSSAIPSTGELRIKFPFQVVSAVVNSTSPFFHEIVFLIQRYSDTPSGYYSFALLSFAVSGGNLTITLRTPGSASAAAMTMTIDEVYWFEIIFRRSSSHVYTYINYSNAENFLNVIDSIYYDSGVASPTLDYITYGYRNNAKSTYDWLTYLHGGMQYVLTSTLGQVAYNEDFVTGYLPFENPPYTYSSGSGFIKYDVVPNSSWKMLLLAESTDSDKLENVRVDINTQTDLIKDDTDNLVTDLLSSGNHIMNDFIKNGTFGLEAAFDRLTDTNLGLPKVLSQLNPGASFIDAAIAVLFPGYTLASLLYEKFNKLDEIHSRLGVPASGTISSHVESVDSKLGNPSPGTITSSIAAIDANIGSPSPSTINDKIDTINSNVGNVPSSDVASEVVTIRDRLGNPSPSTIADKVDNLYNNVIDGGSLTMADAIVAIYNFVQNTTSGGGPWDKLNQIWSLFIGLEATLMQNLLENMFSSFATSFQYETIDEWNVSSYIQSTLDAFLEDGWSFTLPNTDLIFDKPFIQSFGIPNPPKKFRLRILGYDLYFYWAPPLLMLPIPAWIGDMTIPGSETWTYGSVKPNSTVFQVIMDLLLIIGTIVFLILVAMYAPSMLSTAVSLAVTWFKSWLANRKFRVMTEYLEDIMDEVGRSKDPNAVDETLDEKVDRIDHKVRGSTYV